MEVYFEIIFTVYGNQHLALINASDKKEALEKFWHGRGEETKIISIKKPPEESGSRPKY